VGQILHEQLLYPYPLQQIQAPSPLYSHPCQEFCQWFLQ
jgi:hypothetical protein